MRGLKCWNVKLSYVKSEVIKLLVYFLNHKLFVKIAFISKGFPEKANSITILVIICQHLLSYSLIAREGCFVLML